MQQTLKQTQSHLRKIQKPIYRHIDRKSERERGGTLGFGGERGSEGHELAEFGRDSVDLREDGRRREAAVASMCGCVVFLSSSLSFPTHL